MTSIASNLQRFQVSDLLTLGISLLEGSGLEHERARAVAEVLLEGDLLGHGTHGFMLLPQYLEEIRGGKMTAQGDPTCLADHGGALHWDGSYLPGPWLVRKALALGMERIERQPTVTVVIRRSHHIACLQAYLEPITRHGILVLLSSSDPASRVVAPFGGVSPCYSPNPIAAGIPTNDKPILIDISTSSTAFGMCRRKAEAGERLPGSWLLDANGHASNDPGILVDGEGATILPLGGTDLGYKGFALGLLVEALTSALGGHGRADLETRWGASVFIQLINPSVFGGADSFTRESSFLSELCRSSRVADGKRSVRLPGEAALARREKQLIDGVELRSATVESLEQWAKSLQVPFPSAI